MWGIIKSQYWSLSGIATSVLHVATTVAALLMYNGAHQVWTGEPAFKPPTVVVSSKK